MAAVLSCAAGTGAAAIAWSPAAHAGPLCTATYSVQNQWNTGFVPTLTVTNSGTTAITGWTITLLYAGNQRLQNGWYGIWSQPLLPTGAPGPTVTVSNASFNGHLAPGTTFSNIGAVFTLSGTNSPPAVTCTAF
jgi:cellulase/cellobiase CelA1